MEQYDGNIPFPIIADLWRRGKVVPFLGSAASFAGIDDAPSRLPDGAAFAKTLAAKARYPGDDRDPLTKIAQYTQDEPGGRPWLLDFVSEQFDASFDDPTSRLVRPYICALTTFLDRIVDRLPKLIITTNYDTILERTLEKPAFRERGVKYVALSHIMPGDVNFPKMLCYQSLAAKPDILVASRLDQRFREGDYDGHVIIYKMHGTSCFGGDSRAADSIVLTEGDYINFLAENLLNRVPNTVVKMLQAAQLLFLGYSLEDWNFRVLLQRLQKLQKGQRPHWACRKFDENVPAGRIERLFWEKRGVRLYNTDLSRFLDDLADGLTR